MFNLLNSGVPDTPVATRGGGSDGGGGGGGCRDGGGGSGNVSGAGGSGSGIWSATGGASSDSVPAGRQKATHYTKEESVAVARAWDAATSDPKVGTDQNEVSFWKRVVAAYNEFKPRGAKSRDAEQLCKKWSRILPPTRWFAGIYQNKLLHAESGRSEADVKTLSMSQYNTSGHPKFTMWEEYLVLEDCPKFKAICAQEHALAPKRTRHNIAGDYSSGSGSQSFDLNEEQAEEPSATHSRRARPSGQHTSIRRAREAGGSSHRSSAASGSRASQPARIPPSRASEVLRDNVYVHLTHELHEVCSKY
ncbi:glycine, alanine and asparagine-rich protein-like [Salvia splendens]|uniref:glycine, alanine and asparagine-rich protein-like n=1 Tax=Salvia splendens TaxID=180675 RepID=UPI001C257264|nr:glycine, alanine and asparagine-rich protein-like [Salvia splendens]